MISRKAWTKKAGGLAQSINQRLDWGKPTPLEIHYHNLKSVWVKNEVQGKLYPGEQIGSIPGRKTVLTKTEKGCTYPIREHLVNPRAQRK